jgi:chromosome segregation protein
LNFRAREDFEKVKELVEKIQDKLEQLSNEREAIVKMMSDIERQKTEKFMETFEGIRTQFVRIFKTVLEGDADLEVEQDEEGLSGVLIKVRLNDREMSVEALSGGQKTLAALAFIFAIQYFKPSPIYIFDEVEAALDKHNSEKFARMLKDMGKSAQVLIVTHNDHTVKVADQIIGVYMQKGISRIISLPKEKVLSEEKWLSRKEDEMGPENI